MKNQVISSQAGNVAVRVEAFERIVKIIREKDLFQLALFEDLVFPVGLSHLRASSIVEQLPVIGRDGIALEAKERAAHLEQPVDLDGVIEIAELLDEPADFFFRRKLLLFDSRLIQPGRMSELGVVVIAENVGERR